MEKWLSAFEIIHVCF